MPLHCKYIFCRTKKPHRTFKYGNYIYSHLIVEISSQSYMEIIEFNVDSPEILSWVFFFQFCSSFFMFVNFYFVCFVFFFSPFSAWTSWISWCWASLLRERVSWEPGQLSQSLSLSWYCCWTWKLKMSTSLFFNRDLIVKCELWRKVKNYKSLNSKQLSHRPG